MKTKIYSVFKDALFPLQKILEMPYNVALSEMWMEGKLNTYEALAELEKNSVIWDLSEIKKIYSLINFHILYQEDFSCEIRYRDGFEEEISSAPYEHEYKTLSRKQLLFMALILCDDILLDDLPSDYVTFDGSTTIIKTDRYTMRLENPAAGMPGTKFEFEVPGKFEFSIFAFKS